MQGEFTPMKSAILCFSGGIESTTLAYYLKKELAYDDILAISIDYGHRAKQEELFCMHKTCKALGIELKEIKLPWLKKISGSFLTDESKEIPEVADEELDDREKALQRMLWWWVPSRNAIIAIIASAFAEHDLLYKNKKSDIFLGLRRELPMPMPDNTPEFVEALNNLLKYSTLSYHLKEKIEVKAPFIELTKAEIIKKGNNLGIDWRYTYSCYSGNKGNFKHGFPVHCGVCSNCRRRKLAFKKAGVKDKSIYLR